MTTPLVDAGSLGVGEQKTVSGFVYTVSDVDRTAVLGPHDPLTAIFDVTIDSRPVAQPALPGAIAFDLDLDVVEGSGNTSLFEGFESGMGAFEVQTLDQGLSSLAASDGYRCQYNDPDFPNSNAHDFPTVAANCSLTTGGPHGDMVWWGLSGPETSPAGGRGSSGFHSLFFGLDLGPPKNWTTPLGVIEAARTTAPIDISRDAVEPTLSFEHQASFADSRAFALPPGLTYDRGMVAVELAGRRLVLPLAAAAAVPRQLGRRIVGHRAKRELRPLTSAVQRWKAGQGTRPTAWRQLSRGHRCP